MPHSNDFDDIPNERSSGKIDRNKRVLEIIIAIISILFIIILCGMNYVKPLDKMYSPESFYLGANRVSDREDPVSTYKTLKGNAKYSAEYGACDTTWRSIGIDKLLVWNSEAKAMPVIPLDNSSWDADAILDWATQYDGKTTGISGNEFYWYLWKDTTAADDMRIVAPWKHFNFRNNNSKVSTIDVGPSKDGDMYLSIRNAENWFCHIDLGKPCKSHSVKVGLGATEENLTKYDSVDNSFAIIGIATKDTYIVGMKREGSEFIECSPAEVLGLN